MVRLGIDLSRTTCTVVELDVPRRFLRRGAAAPAEMRSVHVLPLGSERPGDLASALRDLRARARLPAHAWAGVWGLSQMAGVLTVPPGTRDVDELARREARSALLRPGDEPAISVAAAKADKANALRPRLVPFIAASRDEIRARIEPLFAAGLVIDGVITPAAALASLARVSAPANPGAVFAYVAVGPTAVAMAIVRDGVLQFGRELPWGYSRAVEQGELDRKTVAERLSIELKRTFVLVKQRNRLDVSQVFVCGDVPELRSLTAPLIETLDIEVETLDSLAGIHTTAALGDKVREDVAGLRLAWAIAADLDPQFNLMASFRRARARSRAWRRLAAAAAVLAGGVLLWNWTARLEPRQQPVRVAPAEPPRPISGPEIVASSFTTTTPSASTPVTVPEVPVVSTTAAPPGPSPVVEPPRPRTSTASTSTSVPVRAAPAPRPSSQAPPRVAPVPRSEPPPPGPLPTVRSILIADDRRVANVDGRIVSIGDRIGSASIVDITPDAVIIREPSGVERRLVLRGRTGGPGARGG